MKWAVLLAILPLATAQELVVVEKKAHALGFYSLDGARVAGVPLRTHPHELIYSPDNRFAYVTENGLLWMTDPGKGGNSIAIVDLKEKKLAGRIELGDNYRPHGMDINPRNWQMVVTVEGPAGLLLIDLKERKVLRRYDTKGDAPHMVTLDKKGEIAWVSNSHSGTLAAVNLATGDVKLIEGGKNTQQSVISADGKFLYLTVSEANVILEIDLSTHKVLRRIETGTFPARLAFYNNGKGLIYNTIKSLLKNPLTPVTPEHFRTSMLYARKREQTAAGIQLRVVGGAGAVGSSAAGDPAGCG